MAISPSKLFLILICTAAAACSELKGSGAHLDAGDMSGGGSGGGDEPGLGGGGTNPMPGDDAGVPGGTCVEGEGVRRCLSFKVEECSAGKWEAKEECANVCEGGTCVGICRPGRDTLCLSDGKTLQTCAESGSGYVGSQACAQACRKGACVECTPNARRCNDSQPQVCDANGAWTNDGTACTKGCNADNGLCNGCSVTEPKKCVDKVVTACTADGTWKAGETCSGGCLNGSCTPCDPGGAQTQCKSDTVEACDATGNWKASKDCAATKVSCVAGACAECKVNAKACNGKIPLACNAQGRWSNGTPCDVYCNPADGTCKECVPDEKRCSPNGDAIDVCNGGTWARMTSCSSGCTAGSSTCNVCTPGEPRCATGAMHAVETCKADGSGWAVSSNCGAYACAAKACKTSCSGPGDCVGVSCIAGKCGVKLPQGIGCSVDGDCGTGFCTDGICCGTRCGEACKSCSSGTCSDIAGDDPGMCSGTRTCSGGCKLRDGQKCSGPGDCVSAICKTYYVDGDGDTWGRKEGEQLCGSSPPTSSNYVDRTGDCCDSDKNAFPQKPWKPVRGQTNCGTGDFDCNGVVNTWVRDWDKNDEDLRDTPIIGTSCTGPDRTCTHEGGSRQGFRATDLTERNCGKPVNEFSCYYAGYCGYQSLSGNMAIYQPYLLCF